VSDNLDIAAEREEIARQSALVTSKRPEGPQHTGHCHYCGDKVPAPMRWCDAACRDAWQEASK
jgi:hypothetical protein